MASSKLKKSVLVLSKILATFFVLMQIHYVTKQPKVLPYISILMLLVHPLGFTVPLETSMNFLTSSKILDSPSTLQRMAGWVQFEASELVLAVTILVGFLALLRLLYLTWRSRYGPTQTEKDELWAAEGKSLVSCFFCYLVGAVVVALVRAVKDGTKPHYDLPSVVFQDLKLLSTLFPDLFLVPQVFLNAFSNSEHSPLSHFFYLGTTFAALMPHISEISTVGNSLDPLQKGHIYIMSCTGLIRALIIVELLS